MSKEINKEARDRAILFLYHIEGYSLRDISPIFGISNPAVLKIIKKHRS